MNTTDLFSLLVSCLAMCFSGFSILYTRRILLLNKSEQERNDHIELTIDIFNIEKNIFVFKNISHRRIIYLESAEYKNVLQSLYSTALGTNEQKEMKLNFAKEVMDFEPNTKIIIYFRDDLGRRFSKECHIYAEDETSSKSDS